MDMLQQCMEIASEPGHTKWICPLLLLIDAFLSMLVVRKVSCTLDSERAKQEAYSRNSLLISNRYRN